MFIKSRCLSRLHTAWRRTASIPVIAALAAGNSAAAPVDLESLAARLPSAGEIHLQMFNADRPDGHMRLGWKRDDTDLWLFDRTMMPSAEVYESFQARLDPASLLTTELSVEFYSGLQTLSIDYRLQDGTGVLRRSLQSPSAAPKHSESELELPPGAVLRALSFLLPLFDTTAVGESLEYTWFEPMGRNPTAEVQLRVTEGGLIETDGTPIETLRYELRGSAPENDIYVSKQAPRRIVRIDVLGTTLQFRTPTN